jgi:hypothetical protein
VATGHVVLAIALDPLVLDPLRVRALLWRINPRVGALPNPQDEPQHEENEYSLHRTTLRVTSPYTITTA